MSRAFTSENDGWLYCTKIRDSCLYALGADQCARSKCIYAKENEDSINTEKTVESSEKEQYGD